MIDEEMYASLSLLFAGKSDEFMQGYIQALNEVIVDLSEQLKNLLTANADAALMLGLYMAERKNRSASSA